MHFFKTLISSFVDSFKIFGRKELIELLYFTYISFRQLYHASTILLVCLLILMVLLFTKTSSIAFLILFWFLNFNCLAFLRPSVDFKNYKYFLSYLLVAIKGFCAFLLIFYLPYSILHFESLRSISIAAAFFLSLFGLLLPFQFSGLKVSSAVCISLFCIAIFIGFMSPIYHFLLMGYLNLENFLNWFLFLFMFDKQLFDISGLAGFLISPAMVFMILGILDSRKTFYYQIHGLIRGLKLFFLNYPIAFIWFNFLRFLIIYAHNLFYSNQLSNNILQVFFFVALYYFYLSFLTNIYVKKVHEQFLIYF